MSIHVVTVHRYICMLYISDYVYTVHLVCVCVFVCGM